MKIAIKVILIFFLTNSNDSFSQSKIDRSKKDLTSRSRTDNHYIDNEQDSNSSSPVSFDNESKNILL